MEHAVFKHPRGNIQAVWNSEPEYKRCVGTGHTDLDIGRLWLLK